MKKLSAIKRLILFSFLVNILFLADTTVLAQDRPGRHSNRGFWMELTEEQRDEIHIKVKEMHCDGMSKEDIEATIKSMVEGYGLQLPEDWEFRSHRYRGGFLKRFGKDLSEDQREAIREKMKEMRCADIPREEYRAEIRQMLEDYGLDIPEDWDSRERVGKGKRLRGLRVIRDQLTEEQRTSLRERVRTMREDGAKREEIRDTVKQMLDDYGVQLPEDGGKLGRGFFEKLMKDLTPEQRDAVKAKIREMREDRKSVV